MASAALFGVNAAHAQSVNVAIGDGTTGICHTPNGTVPGCNPSVQPTVLTSVIDAAGNASEITTNSSQTTILTIDVTKFSRLNVAPVGTALQTNDTSVGKGVIGTQVGVSSASGATTGQVLGLAENIIGGKSEFALEGGVSFLRTRDVTGQRGFLEIMPTRTLLGYSANGTSLTTGLRVTTTQNSLIGNTDVAGTLAVTGASTLNGINNNSAGITNAGLVSGVAAGAVTSTSTEAINGSQLFATNTRVTAAQTTANTAVATAAAAQTTANTGVTNAAAAQSTANTALTNAATAQTTANNALSIANGAQTSANTAITNAATAQTTANGAQTSANTAITNAAAAQTTANTAVTNAAAAQTTANTAAAGAAGAVTAANTANTNALTAVTTANTANTNAATALTRTANAVQYDAAAHTVVTFNPGSTVVALRNVAAGVSATDAVNMSQLNAVSSSVTALGGRVTSLEGVVQDINADLRHLDRLVGRGVAIATAMASVPPIDSDKTFGVGFGVGTYDGRAAFSVALVGRIDQNAQFRLNAGTAGNGKVAAGAGVSFGW